MFAKLVTYRLYQTEQALPPYDATAYQYLLAGNGLFVRTQTRFWSACIPVTRCLVRGLPLLKPHFTLKVPRIPATLLTAVIGDARQQRGRNGRLHEALYHFRHDGQRVRLVRPAQQATSGSVSTRQVGGPDTLLELHTHGDMAAYWSPTDNRDEQGACLYGVLGKLGGRPELRLRVGIYGYWYRLPRAAVFAIATDKQQIDEVRPVADGVTVLNNGRAGTRTLSM
jgi:PRTRC genetic system protein A